ncbi:hypothetical protein [Arthrobacter glacialis]|uniref:hypothetical protein n=1 Tax=Arthrobacter glacialis TaxID=1664 RepID=UPI000CD45BB1|nr:hypothetical protein [Arthrobacter glacialis]POH58256.1 hypothetical protein CVS28_12500 [Arthrobacter glacialis]
MSYNPSVGYRGPDGATRSVTDELTARFGAPARPYEFVTGWKDPDNVSGHNPDSNGITHGVDIFMTPEQNRWAADHLAARGRAGDNRVGYVIYAGQIASPSTGYHFAGSGWEHWDHPHLSVWDGYWGGPCTLPASIFNDTSSWGITTITTGQSSGTIQPIQEDDVITPEDRTALVAAMLDTQVTQVGGGKMTLRDLLAEYRPHVTTTHDKLTKLPGAVVDKEFPRITKEGKVGGAATLSSVLGVHDANVVLTRDVVTSTAAAVAKTVAAIKTESGISPEEQGKRAAAAFLAEVEGLRLTITSAEVAK